MECDDPLYWLDIIISVQPENCIVAPSFLWSKLSRQRWTILNNSDWINGIFNFSRSKIILPHAWHCMNLLNCSFTWSRLQDLLHNLFALYPCAQRKTWRQVAKNMIKKNNSLELIIFFKKNRPVDSFCCMYRCRLESYFNRYPSMDPFTY